MNYYKDYYKEGLRAKILECQAVINSNNFNYWDKLDELQRQNEYIDELLEIGKTPEQKIIDSLIF